MAQINRKKQKLVEGPKDAAHRKLAKVKLQELLALAKKNPPPTRNHDQDDWSRKQGRIEQHATRHHGTPHCASCLAYSNKADHQPGKATDAHEAQPRSPSWLRSPWASSWKAAG
jgi:hypothetical protein